MAINHLNIIARYELKILLRNRIFILFACLSIGGIPLLQYFFQERIPLYHFKALACSFPFINAFLFNFLQSLAVIFVGGDFVRRDQRCDVLEAFRPRPYSNWEYIFGKYITLVFAFFILNIFTILPVLLLHGFVSSSPFDFWLYLFYLFTLTLPSLLFIGGLTVAIYVLVDIPYLALVSLIVFLGVDYFYLAEYGYGSMDFLAITLPNLFSEVTGHVGLDLYLLQRLAVVLVGIALMLLAVSAVKRRDNRGYMPFYWKMMGMLLGIGGIVAGGYYYGNFREDKQQRERYRELYEAYRQKERASILSHHISYRQSDDRIEVVDTLVLKNPGKHFLEEIVLYLNPGLRITSIKSHKGELPFLRKEQVVVVRQALKADSVCQMVIGYQGKVEENICYLDVRDEVYEQTGWSNNLMRYGKRNAMVSDRYTFLTPECLWYPIAAPPVDPVRPWLSDFDFTCFELSVFHDSDRTAISQGQGRPNESGTCFIPPCPLPGISLCIGPYQRIVYGIDSVDFEIYSFQSSKEFITLFNGMPEGIRQGMKTFFEEMEVKYGKSYPYRKLALVEIPVAFSTYLRDWKNGSEFVQPELLFQWENWCKNTEYQPVGKYVEELKAYGVPQSDTALVGNYISNFFMSRFGEKSDEFPALTGLNLLQGHQVVLESVKNPVSLAPMFTDYIRKIHAEEFPGIDRLIEPLCLHHAWLKLFWREVGLPDSYGALRYLQTGSLKKVLMDPRAFPDIEYIFRLKSLFLEKYLSALVGTRELQHFLQEGFGKYIYQKVPLERFILEFQQQFGVDLTPILRQLYEQQGLPVLQIQHIEQKMAREGGAVFVTFEVWNPTKADGVVTCYTKNRETLSDVEEVKSVIIRGGDCCRVTIAVEGRMQNILLHTNLAGNFPAEYETGIQMQLAEAGEIHEGVIPLDKRRFLIPENEIIVDNEDEGFRIEEPSRRRKIFQKQKNPELTGYGDGVDFLTRNFSGWLKSVYSYAYGNSIRSFYGKATENGESKACWEADIPEDGRYELYVYHLGLQSRYQEYRLASYYYTVEQAEYRAHITIGIDKKDKRTVQIKDNAGYMDELEYYMDFFQGDGWVPVGTYDLKKGKSKLLLHDRGAFPGQLVFADAIKWVKQER